MFKSLINALLANCTHRNDNIVKNWYSNGLTSENRVSLQRTQVLNVDLTNIIYANSRGLKLK